MAFPLRMSRWIRFFREPTFFPELIIESRMRRDAWIRVRNLLPFFFLPRGMVTPEEDPNESLSAKLVETKVLLVREKISSKILSEGFES